MSFTQHLIHKYQHEWRQTQQHPFVQELGLVHLRSEQIQILYDPRLFIFS